MNIIFYVEPLIEKNDPYWKTGWLRYCCGNIIKTLNRSDIDFQYLIAVNEPLAGTQVDFDFTKVVFSQEELLAPFDRGYLEASIAWYRDSYSAEQLTYYVDLMRKKMEGFEPDIIITFSPAPFFRAAFPSALLLHHEYSIFSRSPYPESWFLDPCGMSESSFLNTHKQELNLKLNSGEKALVKGFKEACAQVIDQTSPFKEIMDVEKGKFRHLVLLPLQDSSYYSFDGIVDYHSQYDFLVDVLETVPDYIGVVVTMHPDSPAIKPSAFDYLTKKYKHCIYFPEFASYNAISQYLVKATDAVITVSSTVGLQASFFDRKLITLGNSFSYFTDCNRLKDLPSYLSGPDPDNDATLHWIITRYAIQKQDFLDPTWLSSFLLRAFAYYRDRRSIGCDFYDLIKNEDAAYSGLIAFMKAQVPTLPEFVRTRPTPHAQLYCDTGCGFADQPSIKVAVSGDSGLTCLTFRLIPSAPVQALRLVPLTEYVIFELLDMHAMTPLGIVPLTPSKSNAVSREGNIFYFDAKAPSIDFDFNPSEISEVVVNARYLSAGQDALAKIIDLGKVELNKHNERNTYLDEQIEGLNGQIKDLKGQNLGLNQDNRQLNESVRQLSESARQLAERLEAHEQKADELQRSIVVLQDVLAQRDGMIGQLEKSLEEKNDLVLQQEATLDDHKLFIRKLEESLKEQESRVHALTHRLNTYEKEMAQKKREAAHDRTIIQQIEEILAQEIALVSRYKEETEEKVAQLQVHLRTKIETIEQRDDLIGRLETEERSQQQRIEDLLSSASWKITAPLRKLYSIMHR